MPTWLTLTTSNPDFATYGGVWRLPIEEHPQPVVRDVVVRAGRPRALDLEPGLYAYRYHAAGWIPPVPYTLAAFDAAGTPTSAPETTTAPPSVGRVFRFRA